jgi:membrane-associated phospholipid phosphatase
MSDGGPANAIARITTEVFAPANLAVLLVAAISWHSAATWVSALLWAIHAVFFGAVIPLGFIYYGIRQGWWGDRHVRERALRRWPLLVGLVSVAAGTAIGLAYGGPRDLAILGAVMGASLGVMLVVTDRLEVKASMHTFVAVITAAIATLYYGAIGAGIAWPLAAMVAWSRIRLDHHTPAQVVVGALVGVAATSVFTWFR